LIPRVSKQLTLSGTAYPKLKAKREENLRKYCGCKDHMYHVKKAEKIGRANDKKGGE